MNTPVFPTQAYTFVEAIAPVLALTIGIGIAIALLTFIANSIMKAFRADMFSDARPIEINTDMLFRSVEAHLSGRSLAEKPKNDDKLKNDELADPFDPEPDYVSFEALLAEKPKRKLKNDDLG